MANIEFENVSKVGLVIMVVFCLRSTGHLLHEIETPVDSSPYTGDTVCHVGIFD